MTIIIMRTAIAIMGQAYCTEDDQNASTDSRDDTHDHGADDEAGVGVLATADTETTRNDEEHRAPYPGANCSKMEFIDNYQHRNVRGTSSQTTENMYSPNDSCYPGFIRILKRNFV